jgi:hypothetical protein
VKYDRLYNFISPVTGKLPIDRGYTLLGDKDGRSFVSPILIDVRQDIIDLRRKISTFEYSDKLDFNRIWIGNSDNEKEERLHIGIINLPPLAEAVFPNPISPIIGDFRIPNPTFDYLSPFDWVMSGPFLPQIYATKYDTFGNPIGTDISSSLAMTQVRAAQIMKRFDNANFIVGSSVVEFNWENPKMALIPEPLKQLYGLGTTYTFTKAQSLGSLETGLLKNTVNNGTGTLSKAISGEDYVNTADIPFGKLVILDPLYPVSGHKLIAPTDFSTRGNDPNEFGYPTPNIINILTGIAAKFTKFAVTSLTINYLVKSVDGGELKSAEPDVDYVVPSTFQTLVSTVSTIFSTLSALQTAYNLFVAATTAKDIAQDTAIAANTAKDVIQDAEIITAQATATGAATTAAAAEVTATGAAATAAGAVTTAAGAASTAAAASAAATAAGLAITVIQIQLATKASMGDVTSAVNSAINGLTLNNINTTGDIDVKNNQITNIATPTLPSSAVPLSFMQAFVAAAIAAIPPGNINLQGDIITISTIGGITYTQFNVTRDFDVTNYKLVNVKSPEIETDGVNLDFEWNLLQDEVNITWQ